MLIRLRVVSPEKLELERIEKNDERSIQIRGMAFTVSSNVATWLFAALAFVFLWLGYPVPTMLCIGAMYIQFIVLLVSMRIIGKRL